MGEGTGVLIGGDRDGGRYFYVVIFKVNRNSGYDTHQHDGGSTSWNIAKSSIGHH